MPTLLEKIEADAAARLSLPPDRHPSQELGRYKNFLKVESHRLKMLHRAGAGGREVCRARAAILDVLLRYILDAIRSATTGAERRSAAPRCPGRHRRLWPRRTESAQRHRLHVPAHGRHVSTARGKPQPALQALIDGLLYTLWDVGLKVGHSVRSIEDCVSVANSDMQSKTSLIEARLITGRRRAVQALADGRAGQMRPRFRGRLRRGAAGGSGGAARQVRQLGDACRSRTSRTAAAACATIRTCSGWRFSSTATRSLAELREQGSDRRSRAQTAGSGLRFSAARAQRTALSREPPGGCAVQGAPAAVAYNLGYTDRSPASASRRSCATSTPTCATST